MHSQRRTYLYFGAEAETLLESTPIDMIFSDYNNQHSLNDIGTTSQFLVPEYIPGFMIGTKIHSRFSEFGGNVHFMRFNAKGKGVNRDGTNYDQSFNLNYSGFCLHYNANWINTNYFRTGPGIGMKLEQFRFKIVDELADIRNTAIPVDRAMVSGKLYYSISLGGPKFNFDIVAFYNFPFMTLDLTNFNQYLNNGYQTEYTTSEMEFTPTAYGVSVYIGLGSRENYDF